MTTRQKLLFVVLVCVLAGVGWLRSRPHPVPAAFAAKVTLAEALSAQSGDQKPVIAFYTADWCGPCGSLKRNALADPRVEALFKQTHAAFVDCTNGHPTDDAYGVEGYPTLLEIRDGQEVSRVVGAVPTDELIEWLQTAIGRK